MHVQPDVSKTYGTHSVADYHVGTSMVQYRCQWIYLAEKNDIRVRDIILYKHKYLIISTRTKIDAIEDATKDPKKAIEGGLPQSNMDRETLNKLMDIFKKNANAYKRKDAERQRVQKQSVQGQIVYTKQKQ